MISISPGGTSTLSGPRPSLSLSDCSLLLLLLCVHGGSYWISAPLLPLQQRQLLRLFPNRAATSAPALFWQRGQGGSPRKRGGPLPRTRATGAPWETSNESKQVLLEVERPAGRAVPPSPPRSIYPHVELRPPSPMSPALASAARSLSRRGSLPPLAGLSLPPPLRECLHILVFTPQALPPHPPLASGMASLALAPSPPRAGALRPGGLAPCPPAGSWGPLSASGTLRTSGLPRPVIVTVTAVASSSSTFSTATATATANSGTGSPSPPLATSLSPHPPPFVPLVVPSPEPWPALPPAPDATAPPTLGGTAARVAEAMGPVLARAAEDTRQLAPQQWVRQTAPVLAYQGARMAFFLSQYFVQAVAAAPLLNQAQKQQRSPQQQAAHAPSFSTQPMPAASTTNSVGAATATAPAQPPSLPSLEDISGVVDRLSRVGASMATRVLPGALEMVRRDAAYIAQGVYRAPYDMDPRHRQWRPSVIGEAVQSSADFTTDVIQRRIRNGWQETLLFSEEARVNGDKYPEYYLQNFHYQDGWLSEFSARGYEVATETLFLGTQDAMQRAGLVPLHYFMKGREGKETVLLDLACGTGRFLTFIKDNYPDMKTIGVDLSPFFLEKAQENMKHFAEFNRAVHPSRSLAPTEFLQAKAEELPLDDASLDVVSCVYLFHEIPPEVRRQVAAEMHRVLRPGGIVILNDSIQRVDNPPVNVSFFPAAYHEPYYESYQQEDFPALFEAHGFALAHCAVAHFSKVWCFQKL